MDTETLTLEALRETQHCAGWMLTIAEHSEHPDAIAAARWLEATGYRSFNLANAKAIECAKLMNAPFDQDEPTRIAETMQ